MEKELIFISFLICVKHYAEYFIHVFSFLFNSLKKYALLSPMHRSGNWKLTEIKQSIQL